MEDSSVLANNKLIDTFMASQEGGKLNVMPDEWYLKRCKYHSSWDWLMPVVEKITQHKFTEDNDNAYIRTFGMLSSDTNKPMVRINRYALWEAPTLIEATYLAVVDYIKQ